MATRFGSAMPCATKLHAVCDVVLHRPSPLLETAFPKLPAVARRAAKVYLENGVTAVSQKLDLGIEGPGVARPRSAVHINDYRQVLWITIFRESQVTRNAEAVARLVG